MSAGITHHDLHLAMHAIDEAKLYFKTHHGIEENRLFQVMVDALPFVMHAETVLRATEAKVAP